MSEDYAGAVRREAEFKKQKTKARRKRERSDRLWEQQRAQMEREWQYHRELKAEQEKREAEREGRKAERERWLQNGWQLFAGAGYKSWGRWDILVWPKEKGWAASVIDRNHPEVPIESGDMRLATMEDAKLKARQVILKLESKPWILSSDGKQWR
jgi:hypothetical protein